MWRPGGGSSGGALPQNRAKMPFDLPIHLELYIGYYKSQRQGATYHSPKNCLPGSGWAFLHTGTIALHGTQAPGPPVEINKFIIQKGLDKQLVLYWYQDRGRIITSEYWAKVGRLN